MEKAYTSERAERGPSLGTCPHPGPLKTHPHRKHGPTVHIEHHRDTPLKEAGCLFVAVKGLPPLTVLRHSERYPTLSDPVIESPNTWVQLPRGQQWWVAGNPSLQNLLFPYPHSTSTKTGWPQYRSEIVLAGYIRTLVFVLVSKHLLHTHHNHSLVRKSA